MSAPNSNYDPVEVDALQPRAVDAAVRDALAAIVAAQTLDELKAAKSAHAGDKSALALANREIGALPPAAKADAGKRVGQARARVKQALAEREALLLAQRDERVLREERLDLSALTTRRRVGTRHPLTSLQERLTDIFVAMGWQVGEGPEVEAEWFNFDALNFGPDHPARQMQDTFFVDPPESGLVLRTHTSPVQARALLEYGAPLYLVCPGKTFRTDELDATHTPVFHQVEGIAVDTDLTMAHLKGTLDHMAMSLFGDGITTRLRPSYFPFTEPSAEIDLRCFVCIGLTGALDTQCRTCGGTGWIEWGGSGMVHPNVLRACGIDAAEYQGFAFGMGIERTLMFRNGVPDMRDMVEGDVRFNAQFAVGG